MGGSLVENEVSEKSPHNNPHGQKAHPAAGSSRSTNYPPFPDYESIGYPSLLGLPAVAGTHYLSPGNIGNVEKSRQRRSLALP